jgi:hypothetical protein
MTEINWLLCSTPGCSKRAGHAGPCDDKAKP